MNSRSSTAVLSPVEVAALRHIANGSPNEVPADHLKVLMAMGLASLDPSGGAALTTDGRRRLDGEHAAEATG